MASLDPLLQAQIFVHTCAFLLGAVWGSFLNVVIYRVPLKLSLMSPPSRCPSCETPIKARDNIPILGWLILKGRCRSCGVKISPRYPLIELLVAVLTLGISIKVFDGRLGQIDIMVLLVPFCFLFLFILALVTLFFIDLDTTELPPEITIPMTFVGVLGAFLVDKGPILATLTPNITVYDSMLGAIIGGGLILVLFIGYYVTTGRAGIGGGDIWMMGMVGAFVGWEGLLFIYLASSLQGIIVAVAALSFGGKQQGEGAQGLFRNEEVNAMNAELRGEDGEVLATDGDGEEEEGEGFGQLAVPFGPFIALSAVEYIFLGHIFVPLLSGGFLGPNGSLM